MSLADFAGRKLVLYFYPRADTSGCTKEAIDFSRLRGDFARAGTDILGVSADPVPALAKFKAKHKLSIALASDEKHRMLEAYGVWQEKSMYGRKFLGIVRTTFLIGPDGRIAKVWPKVSVDGPRRRGSRRCQSALIVAETFTQGRKIAAAICGILTINGPHSPLGQPASLMAGPGGSVNVAVVGVSIASDELVRRNRPVTSRAKPSRASPPQSRRPPQNLRLHLRAMPAGRSGSDRWRSGSPSAPW